MISRNSIKKIPLNRRHAYGLAGRFLFQPPAQFGGVPATMPNGQHNNLTRFRVDGEVNRIRPRLGNLGLVSQTGGQRKPIGPSGQGLQKFPERVIKPEANPGRVFLMPVNRFIPVPLRFGLGDDLKRHFLAAKRFLISAETSSIRAPRPGFFKASSARRSSSAACSGVRSGSTHPSSAPNSSQTCSTKARFSSAGNVRICSMSSILLMPLTYPVNAPAQAAFSARAVSSFILHPSSFAA